MDKGKYSCWRRGRCINPERNRCNTERKPTVKTGDRYLKKGYDHIRQKINESELTLFIDENKNEHPIQKMCKILGVPRSTYYESLNETESNRTRENKQLTARIIEIHKESKKRYGAPKIHHVLRTDYPLLSLKRVQRLMRKAGIRSIVKKKYRPYSSKEKVIEQENLLNRDFSTTNINQKWVTDITYIHTIKNGWCYLASVMDFHTKKIVGHSCSRL